MMHATQARGKVSADDTSLWGCLSRVEDQRTGKGLLCSARVVEMPHGHRTVADVICSLDELGSFSNGWANAIEHHTYSQLCLNGIPAPMAASLLAHWAAGKQLSGDLLQAEVAGIILGGLDTTAQTCAFTLCATPHPFPWWQHAFMQQDPWSTIAKEMNAANM